MGMFQKNAGSNERQQNLDATLILIYGHICLRAEPNFLKTKIEVGIINNILGHID